MTLSENFCALSLTIRSAAWCAVVAAFVGLRPAIVAAQQSVETLKAELESVRSEKAGATEREAHARKARLSSEKGLARARESRAISERKVNLIKSWKLEDLEKTRKRYMEADERQNALARQLDETLARRDTAEMTVANADHELRMADRAQETAAARVQEEQAKIAPGTERLKKAAEKDAAASARYTVELATAAAKSDVLSDTCQRLRRERETARREEVQADQLIDTALQEIGQIEESRKQAGNQAAQASARVIQIENTFRDMIANKDIAERKIVVAKGDVESARRMAAILGQPTTDALRTAQEQLGAANRELAEIKDSLKDALAERQGASDTSKATSGKYHGLVKSQEPKLSELKEKVSSARKTAAHTRDRQHSALTAEAAAFAELASSTDVQKIISEKRASLEALRQARRSQNEIKQAILLAELAMADAGTLRMEALIRQAPARVEVVQAVASIEADRKEDVTLTESKAKAMELLTWWYDQQQAAAKKQQAEEEAAKQQPPMEVVAAPEPPVQLAPLGAEDLEKERKLFIESRARYEDKAMKSLQRALDAEKAARYTRDRAAELEEQARKVKESAGTREQEILKALGEKPS